MRLLGLATLLYLFCCQVTSAFNLLKTVDKLHTALYQPSVRNGKLITSSHGQKLSYTIKSRHQPGIDKIKLRGIHMPPGPAVGEPTTVGLDFIPLIDLEGVFADVTIHVGSTKLVEKRFDVCQELLSLDASVQCPFPANEQQSLKATVILPNYIPKARYGITVDFYSMDEETEDREPLSRFTIDADFLFHESWLETYEHLHVAAEKVIQRGQNILSNGIKGRKSGIREGGPRFAEL